MESFLDFSFEAVGLENEKSDFTFAWLFVISDWCFWSTSEILSSVLLVTS